MQSGHCNVLLSLKLPNFQLILETGSSNYWNVFIDAQLVVGHEQCLHLHLVYTACDIARGSYIYSVEIWLQWVFFSCSPFSALVSECHTRYRHYIDAAPSSECLLTVFINGRHGNGNIDRGGFPLADFLLLVHPPIHKNSVEIFVFSCTSFECTHVCDERVHSRVEQHLTAINTADWFWFDFAAAILTSTRTSRVR